MESFVPADLSESEDLSLEVPKKHAGGRPRGRKIEIALASGEVAATAIQEMGVVVDTMNPQQKLLFESVMSGDDALVTALKSGNTQWFTGITKKLFDSDGGSLAPTHVTLENVHDLDQRSYTRLLTICESQIRNVTGNVDYRLHTEPIKEFIKRFAPMALGTIVGIAQAGVKEENRLKAAKDLLDRAGEAAEAPDKEITIPVQVNIMLNQNDGTTTVL